MTEFDRSELSFEQAEGLVALPTSLALRQVSDVLRARLWNCMLERVQYEMRKNSRHRTLGPVWEKLFRDYCVKQLALYADTIGGTFNEFLETIKPLIQQGSYAKALSTIEWFVQQHQTLSFSNSVRLILEEERCAYRLVDNFMVPISSPEEGQAVINAVEALSTQQFGGGRAHLLKAGSLLTSGDFAGSVRESIHSVESVARTMTGETSLSAALQKLQKQHPMHPALAKGFNSIYGYTSDANGIRHPMVGDEGPAVGEAEAIFMFGACASFVTYLTRIAQP